jgi:6-phosphogluconolactonase
MAQPQSSSDSTARQYLLFVGTYTKAEGKGIYAYRYDGKSGKCATLGLAAETTNPSFMVGDRSQRFLYVVNEVAHYRGASSGSVGAYAIDRSTGRLSLLNEVASGGADPCYIALDQTGTFALVANYTGGSLAVLPILSNGRLGEATAFVQHRGAGKNPDRQEGPHAHWIETTPDNRLALVADLGLDEIRIYRFNPAQGSLVPNDPHFVKVEPGAGPRHITFSPDGCFVYVINEMASTVTVFSFDSTGGALQSLQSISTLPPEFKRPNDTAQICVHPGGKFLFASNRGHDSIAVFVIDQVTGKLTLVDHSSTQGKTPRHFATDPAGSRLLVANQDASSVVVFDIDLRTGRLTATGERFEVPSPVCLRFVEAS